MQQNSIAAIIPVAPSEPLDVIERSVASLQALDIPEGYSFRAVYVIDTEDRENDERIPYLEEQDDTIAALVREPGHGRRAGAINSGLDSIETPEYIALLDVDSRPPETFLTQSLHAMQEEKDTVLVSGGRRIVNRDENFITKTAHAEFRLLSDLQFILDRKSGFCHFNGLIGLLDGAYLDEKRLDPSRTCEDVDFSERAYEDGKRVTMVPGMEIGEQAATNLRDLYSQKRRWVTGAIESLDRHFLMMMQSNVALRVKFLWTLSMISPFISFLISPFALLYSLRFLSREEDRLDTPVLTAGLFFYGWLVSIAGYDALYRYLTGEGVTWTVPERSAA
ncbi:MAG: glycosyltransferase family 2 protein [Candidatus Nanohaloarchaea archaeon]|nr:glycosyltransferase family 2 protein [Candidatus Nanohaloarchaea archaeon]